MFSVCYNCCIKYQNIEKHLEQISNIESFISQYNWKGIDFPSHEKDWKKLEQNNKTIARNILYVPPNTKQIRLAYKSKCNCKHENQVILLIITDAKRSDEVEKWHYLAVKNLSRLLRGITSNHNGDFYCLNCFHSHHTKIDLKNMKEYVTIMITVI